MIAVIKNRYKKWLNRLPENNCTKKLDKIQEFVRTIWTTEKETILKACEKTKLTTDFDFDQELKNADVEGEFILQMEMTKLMIHDFRNDDECSENEVSEICTIPDMKKLIKRKLIKVK